MENDMSFKLFKNGNKLEVYHTDIGYDELFGWLVINPDGNLSMVLNDVVMMTAKGARAVADFLDEWEDNQTVREILEDKGWRI